MTGHSEPAAFVGAVEQIAAYVETQPCTCAAGRNAVCPRCEVIGRAGDGWPAR